MNTTSLKSIWLFLIIISAFAFMMTYSGCTKEEGCTATTWYKDADRDGLGDPEMTTSACEHPAGYVSNNNDNDDTRPAPVDITVNAQILSENNGDLYPIRIFIPKEYEDNKNLPVVYLLDGLVDFMGKPFHESLVSFSKSIELKAILVGVGNKTGMERALDFAPAGCGGGDGTNFDNFYKFLTEEVIPYIDERYQSDQGSRTLIGFSAAGNFANFALFRENPESIIFHGFISVDPNGCQTSIYEEQLNKMDFPEGTSLKFHLSKAALDAEILYGLLVERDFPFLEIEFQDYPTETHESVIIPAITRGLKFIYE